MIDDILIKFGYNGAEVEDGLRNMEKGAKGLGESIGKLGLATSVFAVFGMAIKEVFTYSQNLTGELNENERAARSAANAATEMFTELKAGALEAGANTIGVFNRIGDGIGTVIVNTGEFFGVMKEGSARAMEISAQAEETLRKQAEWMAKNGAEHKKLNEQIAQGEEAKQAAMRKSVEPAQQLIALTEKRAKLEQQASYEDENSIAQKKLRVEIAKVEVEMIGVQKAATEKAAAEEKKRADERKKDAEEIAKIEKDHARAVELSRSEEIELMALLGKNQATLTKAERERLAQLQAQKQVLENEYTISQIMAKPLEERNAGEKKIVAELTEQNAKLKEQSGSAIPAAKDAATEQLGEEKKITAEIEAQNKKKRIGVSLTRTGSLGSVSDWRLDYLISRKQAELTEAERGAWAKGGQREVESDVGVMVLKSEIANLKKEKANRAEEARLQAKEDAYNAKHMKREQYDETKTETYKIQQQILKEQQEMNERLAKNGFSTNPGTKG